MPMIPDINVAGGISSSMRMGSALAQSATAPTGFASMLSSFSSNPLAGPILSGIGSMIQGRAARKAAEKNRSHDIRMQRTQGDEARKNDLYRTLLGDWKERKDKFRMSQGLGNYRAYAQQSGNVRPGSNTERMLNFQSPNRIQDPGAAPDPKPLFTNDWSKKRSRHTSYNITPDGRLETTRGSVHRQDLTLPPRGPGG